MFRERDGCTILLEAPQVLAATLAILALLPQAPPESVAAPPASIAPASDLDRFVAELDSDILDVREHAQERLAQANLSVRDLVSLMSKPGLSAEQTLRLEQLGDAAMRASPRGALGVSFDLRDLSDDEGVRIMSLLKPERFPAAQVLRAGDVMTRLGGTRVRTPDDALVAIVSGDPGQTIEVDVLRENVPVKLKVSLGRWADLDRERVLIPSLLRQAWSIRIEREKVGVKSPTVDAKLPRGAWTSAVLDLDPDANDGRFSIDTRPVGLRRGVPAPEVAASGSSRVSRRVDLTMSGGRLQDAADRMAAGGTMPGRRLNPDQLLQDLNRARRILNDPNQPAQRREWAREQVDLIEGALKQFQPAPRRDLLIAP